MNQELQVAGQVFSVVKDITVTGLLFWLVFLLMTGRLVRREELDRERAERETCTRTGDYWRDKYLEAIGTAKAAVETVKVQIDALSAAVSALANRRGDAP